MGVIGKTTILGGTVAIAVVALAAFPTDGLTPAARAEIPGHMVEVYQSAAKARCVGLPWQVLAAIGWVESRHGGGSVDPDTGDVTAPITSKPLDGTEGAPRLADGAQAGGFVRPEGPMGLLPAAWSRYAVLAPRRPTGAAPSIQNAWDAAYTTANELCGGAPLVNDLNRAIRSHTPRPSHVMEILLKAARYGSGDVPDVEALVTAAGPAPAGGERGAAASSVARDVVLAASRVLGTPYVWGAEDPAAGFDCSGLVFWAYGQAGVRVARTTDSLIGMGEGVADGTALRAGDLLFTLGGRPIHDLGHVAIYAGGGYEIVAPSSGKSVTVQRVDMGRVQAVRRILPA